ncbi:ABC transporter permease [Streptomyces sp. NBC_00503]|uniref:ABC transporter permease n=1 Tax=Streptomyces sp. NBC_00503 TaxID=2903659 RepID=UPI002E816E80|nr:ABC transporter permease [Streptomyces sp. NBC_00503]WUD85245.1 ABC transporter permease [Streptomyces sp. NBC_00503]
MTTLASAPATDATAQAASPAEPPARFRDLIASEWIKTRSLRSTPWVLAFTTLFVIGSAAVASLSDKAAGSEPGSFLAYDSFSSPGCMTLILVAGTMGALAVVSEYGSGLIRTTFAAVPDRGAVVLAKAVVTAVLWTAVGTVAALGSFFVSQAVLNGHDAAVPLTHPDVFRPLVASALLAPVCALTGLGLGVLLRHAAGTVLTAVFALLMLPTMFSESNRWSADIKHTMVSAAWTRLVQTWEPDPDSLGYSATLPGCWIVFALWPLIAVALAVAVVRNRDV